MRFAQRQIKLNYTQNIQKKKKKKKKKKRKAKFAAIEVLISEQENIDWLNVM